jgi:hypothetical protein
MMLNFMSAVTGALLLAGVMLTPSSPAEANRREAVLACGGPARSYNQCIQVCGCLGGERCASGCSQKDFSQRPGARGKGKAARGMGKRAGRGSDGGGRRGFKR